MNKTLNKHELIEQLERCPAGVVQWVIGLSAEGLRKRVHDKKLEQVSRGKFDLSAVYAAEMAAAKNARPTVTNLQASRAQKLRADKIEVELAEKRGELVSAQEIATAIDRIAAETRQAFEGLASRLGTDVEPHVRSQIDDEVRATLERTCSQLENIGAS